MSVWRTNRFWSVSLEHTLFFRFFETFCEHASRSKLRGKKKVHLLDLRIKSYGCLKFQGEVWAGWACAGANEEESTTCAKFWGQEVGGRGQGEYKKGDPCRSGRRPPTAPRPTVADCWSPLFGRPLDGQWSSSYPASSGRREGDRSP
jgi:hypothetical protein